MYDVIIVGLGPVGAMLAGLLGGKGVRVLAVERDTQIYPLPRAVHLDHEVMRLLSLVGADQVVLDTSRPTSSYDFETANGELLMGFAPPPTLAPTGYPWSNIFHQPTLEEALRGHLAHHPNVEIRLGTEFISFDESAPDAISAEIGGTKPERVSARYLVGCDGGRSPVRRQAGIGLDDMDFNEPWVVVDTLLPDGCDTLHTASRQICDPARPVTSIPVGHGRHRWEFMLLPGETADQMTDSFVLEHLIPPQLPEGITADDITIERSAVYTFHGVFAEKWRKGRVLLAGDAAHQMPPFMGQGLCSGIRDAVNLAWKLEAVLTGEAPDTLLDTVQGEREPQVRFITETAIGMGQIVCTHDPELAKARDSDMCAKSRNQRISEMPSLPPIDAGVSVSPGAGQPFAKDAQLDRTSGYNPVFVLKTAAMADDVRTSGALPAGMHLAWLEGDSAVADPEKLIAAQLGDADAMLVRADKVIFGTGTPSDLTTAYQHYLSGRGA